MLSTIKRIFSNRWIKFSSISIAIVIAGFMLLMQYIMSFAPTSEERKAIKLTRAHEVPYLSGSNIENRGKILAVVTSTDRFAVSGKTTGYELTELARAYWVFTVNGFEVDIASPKGGDAPKVIDADDMGIYDYAFLNDPVAQLKAENTLSLDTVDPQDYKAIYLVGGKGAMYDFPNNASLKEAIKNIHSRNGVISAVCHGPAGLLNIDVEEGGYLITDKKISAFTNEEELFLIPNAEEEFGFLLESKLEEQGADFRKTSPYLSHMVWDGQIITGQNPWSVWELADAVIKQLGYEPVDRPVTAEENSMKLLTDYERGGYGLAKEGIAQSRQYSGLLILMHGIVAGMQGEFSKAFDLVVLAHRST